ncbi:MAG: 3-phosphoserine/phosphohydroxythreonine transaminase [Bacteroidetes bacterium]|nr:MAG: 3-phosphoserine/phosphohydroxythreonine transaminase [Bacteroidota bacterium]
MKKHNFSAGPAILPQEVLQQASEAALNYNGTGLSILEMSHRGKEVVAVMDEAVQLVKELLHIGDDHEVLFLTGGASSQFFMTAMNYLGENETGAYVDTGSWSSKAIKEAKNFGKVQVVASSKDRNYTYIPKGYEIPSDSKYVHITSNNTIFGTQHHVWPETNVPFICDMSSDIFSRPIDMSRFGLIYAGAQKNLGPAGTTLVILKKGVFEKIDRVIPTMLNYETHIAKKSAFNTPPVYAIYICMLTLRWLKKNGGLTAMEKHNQAKAKMLYEAMDANPCFTGTAEREDRSLMNATFVMAKGYEALGDAFLEAATREGCVGLKGHRSVGGFRASIYNAMPMESVRVLVDIMTEFGQKHG